MKGPGPRRVLVACRRGLARHGKTVRLMAVAALEEMGVHERELSVLLTDDREIRELNLRYRGIDKATDVLSFPMDDPRFMGDVAISIDTAERQAGAYGASLDQELLRLLVHGILHLLGYDHAKGGPEARAMRAREKEILKALNPRGSGR